MVNDFVKWLKGWNDVIVSDGKMHEAVGFYGLDLYSLFRSADAVIEYLEKVDSEAAERARRRFSPDSSSFWTPPHHAVQVRYVESLSRP